MRDMTVLVTGCSRGLGLEFARQFRAGGANVLAAVRDPEHAPTALRQTGARILKLDVNHAGDIDALTREVSTACGLDLLVNNAGVISDDPTAERISADELRRVFETNAFAPAVLSTAMLPALRKGRRRAIWNISSELGSIASATPGFSIAYSASKAALNMITARFAKDLAPEGFTVVSFCPGWNRTDMGGAQAPLDPTDSIAKLIATGLKLGPNDSGSYRRIDGSVIPW